MALQETQQAQTLTVSARGTWQDGVRTDVYLRDFTPIVMDEPEILGGTDKGPNPMEYVLGSLIGCTAVITAMAAREIGFEYYGLSFEVSGDIDLRGLMGVDGVCPHFARVWGQAVLVTDEPVERLQELKAVVESRCPAFNLLKDAGAKPQMEWLITKEK